MHRHRRVSRPLIAALGITIVLGLFFYLNNVRRAHAAEQRADALRQSQEAKLSRDAKLASDSTQAPVPSSGPSVAPSSPLATQGPVVPAALVTQTPGIARPGVVPGPAAGKVDAAATRPASAALTSSPLNTAPVTPAAPTVVSYASSAPLSDAKAKRDAGDLVAARGILSDALTGGRLSGGEADAARQQLSEVNQTLVFSPKRTSDDPLAIGYQVQSGERLSSIAARNGVTWELLARVNGIEPRRLRSGATIKVIKGPFHAVVTKSKFRMDIYLGSPGEAGAVFVTTYPVGLGKDGSTPTGTWQVESGNKIRHPTYYSPRGEGVIEANDPKNPLGGFWIGLAGVDGQAVGKNSYGVHGTIDPNSIGKQESMGCIRLKAEDIAVVFDLLIEGKSKVVVKD